LVNVDGSPGVDSSTMVGGILVRSNGDELIVDDGRPFDCFEGFDEDFCNNFFSNLI
jgi:hypothetical protein